jgi:hypothetical protein
MKQSRLTEERIIAVLREPSCVASRSGVNAGENGFAREPDLALAGNCLDGKSSSSVMWPIRRGRP